MNHPRRQSGIALLTALLIVALAAVAAAGITRDQYFNVRRTENFLHADQAYLQALGVESWGRGMLARDLENDQKTGFRIDALVEAWNAGLPQTEVEGGYVRGQIEDLQGRFNLNNLLEVASGGQVSAQLAYLQRLLLRLEIDPLLAQSIADWLDADVDTRYPGGAEDLFYMRAKPPYRAANRGMSDISELLLVQGITPEIYTRLAPYVTALPQATTINVNTAPAMVLAALPEVVDDHTVEQLMDMRQSQPFTSIEAFMQAVKGQSAGLVSTAAQDAQAVAADGAARADAAAAAQGPNPTETLIGVASDYFVVHAQTEVDHMRVRLDTVIARNAPGGPQILARNRQPY